MRVCERDGCDNEIGPKAKRFCSKQCTMVAVSPHAKYETEAEREEARREAFRRANLRKRGHEIPLVQASYKTEEERESPRAWARRVLGEMTERERRAVGELSP